MNTHDIKAASQRLAILQLLAEDSNYSLNDSLLKQMLAASGTAVSRDVLRAELAWLEDLGLVSQNALPSCTSVILREAGLDVAQGNKVIPGIAKIGLS